MEDRGLNVQELLAILHDLAENAGFCLHDWNVEDVDRLYHIAVKLTETARDVSADLYDELEVINRVKKKS